MFQGTCLSFIMNALKRRDGLPTHTFTILFQLVGRVAGKVEIHHITNNELYFFSESENIISRKGAILFRHSSGWCRQKSGKAAHVGQKNCKSNAPTSMLV